MDKKNRNSSVSSHKSSIKAEPNRIAIDALLKGKPELIIEHAGEDYRLRITSNRKLILTK